VGTDRKEVIERNAYPMPGILSLGRTVLGKKAEARETRRLIWKCTSDLGYGAAPTGCGS